MRLLLDTHIFLWLITNDDRLAADLRHAISDSDNDIYLSVVNNNLQAGDVGTVVDRHDVAGLEPGYNVEFFDTLGQTIAVATLPGSLLRVPTHSDRPAVRSSALSE